MNYYKNNIKHVRGDTYSFGMVVEDEVLESVYFTCRDGLNDNSPVLFQKSLDNGISITETEEQDDVTLYKYAIRIDPLDTKDINSGTYYYDLQIELNGDVLTIMKGRFIIEQDCTRSEKVIDEIVVKINEINGEVVGISVMDKLDYLEDTKNLIKDSLNYLGEEVSDDDTFRSYADVITGLYDYMEKVTDEGTDVTLNNTRVGPLKLSPKGNTTQNTTTGKNKLPNDLVSGSSSGITYTKNSDGSITLSGTATARVEPRLTTTAITLPAGTYKNTTSTPIYYYSTTYGQINSGGGTVTFSSDTTINYFYIRVENGTTISTTIYPQLILSSESDTTYEPYTNGASPNPDYPQDIEVVTGDNTITISNEDDTETQTQLISLGDIELCKIGNYQDYLFKASGTNLSTLNSISTTGGGYINYSVSQLAEVEQGKTYTLSVKNNTSETSNLNIRITSDGTYSTETQGNLVANGIKSYTFTASKSGTLNLNSRLGTTDTTNALTQVMLNLGTTALPYEPYGNGWYKKQVIGKVILNGSESWNFSTYGTKYRASTSVSDIYTSQTDNTTSQLYSNYFLKGAYNVANENSVTARYNVPQLNFFITLATSKTEWTTWLGTHNTTVYYPLETPNDIEITDTTLIGQLDDLDKKLKSYDPQTNITSVFAEGNAQMIISATALKKGGN